MLHGEPRGIHIGAVRWGWAPHWGSISRVSGEWCTTQKEAKASYKAALKNAAPREKRYRLDRMYAGL